MIPTIQKASSEKFRKNPIFFIFNLTLPMKISKADLEKIQRCAMFFYKLCQGKFNSHLTKRLQNIDF